MKSRNINFITSLTFTCAVLFGCATPPEKIATAYVSPLQYEEYNCKQIADEGQRLTEHVTELQSSLQQEASHDSTKMGVGLILFWPTLFFIHGDGPQAAEYARLKGERDALEQVAMKKECGDVVPKIAAAAPPETPKPTGYSPVH